jgi:PmbA protein
MDKQIAEKIIALTRNLGADASEVYLRSYTSTTIEIKEQKVDAFDQARDRGAGLRVVIAGRLGFAFTTDLSGSGITSMAEAAVTNARNTEPDLFIEIPEKPTTPYQTVSVHDPNIVNLTEREKIDRVMAMERETFAVDPRIKRIRKAAAGFSEAETTILNSHGAVISYRSTACSSSVEAVAEEKGESQAGSDFDVSRFYHELEIEEVGRRAARRALDLLGAKSIDSTRAPVVLDTTVAQEFLSMLAGGFSAESVQKKRSLFMGKLDAVVQRRPICP